MYSENVHPVAFSVALHLSVQQLQVPLLWAQWHQAPSPTPHRKCLQPWRRVNPSYSGYRRCFRRHPAFRQRGRHCHDLLVPPRLCQTAAIEAVLLESPPGLQRPLKIRSCRQVRLVLLPHCAPHKHLSCRSLSQWFRKPLAPRSGGSISECSFPALACMPEEHQAHGQCGTSDRTQNALEKVVIQGTALHRCNPSSTCQLHECTANPT
mmetsp:Transcript_30923/g.59719  ORF Transcript_30923/g.59719 Transcript_30923/m.59719 type:complete len:208 (+) Transcript_30923:160-783(+)